jgi:hypothetical protein
MRSFFSSTMNEDAAKGVYCGRVSTTGSLNFDFI